MNTIISFRRTMHWLKSIICCFILPFTIYLKSQVLGPEVASWKLFSSCFFWSLHFFMALWPHNHHLYFFSSMPLLLVLTYFPSVWKGNLILYHPVNILSLTLFCSLFFLAKWKCKGGNREGCPCLHQNLQRTHTPHLLVSSLETHIGCDNEESDKQSSQQDQ